MELDSYITTAETKLSPAVVVTTILLLGFFALGVGYWLVRLVL